MLSHVPINDASRRNLKGNIHGHLHHNNVMIMYANNTVEKDGFYINVSAEQINLTPISFDELNLNI